MRATGRHHVHECADRRLQTFYQRCRLIQSSACAGKPSMQMLAAFLSWLGCWRHVEGWIQATGSDNIIMSTE